MKRISFVLILSLRKTKLNAGLALRQRADLLQAIQTVFPLSLHRYWPRE